MKISKLPSGSYRIQPYIDGIRNSIAFDHKPTTKEINQAIYARKKAIKPDSDTFECCANKYISIKENVLSPSTIRSYKGILKKLPKDFIKLPINKIDNVEMQRLVNDLAVELTQKSIKNYRGFILSVIRLYLPNTNINVTLPQNHKTDDYIPSAKEVKAVLRASEGTKWYKYIMLGCYGLRRSEILPLTDDDIKDGFIHINKSMVLDSNNCWITKEFGKTESSLRKVPIAPEFEKLLKEEGIKCDFHPDKLLHHLKQFQKKAKVKQFTFHRLRHFFCTEMSQVLSEEDVLSLGGWSTPFVMKRVYRHQRVQEDEKMQKKAASKMSSLLQTK